MQPLELELFSKTQFKPVLVDTMRDTHKSRELPLAARLAAAAISAAQLNSAHIDPANK